MFYLEISKIIPDTGKMTQDSEASGNPDMGHFCHHMKEKKMEVILSQQIKKKQTKISQSSNCKPTF